MLVQLTPNQARVIGVLLEKEITTPDQYPLSLNALTLGCNQKSNRDPVMQLSEADVQDVIDELNAKNMLFEVIGSGSRVVKYKHRFCNTEFSNLKLTAQQLSIICVMLLRGPQTPGELRTRTNRLADFSNVAELESVLHSLTNLNTEILVMKLAREPGKRESRFAHLFCGEPEASIAPDPQHPQTDTPADISSLQRIEQLEAQVADLIDQVKSLQESGEILSE
jgi:uncharacterized protein YceH (UPF0502 family)